MPPSIYVLFTNWLAHCVPSGGVLKSEGRFKRRNESSGSFSSSARRVLDSLEVEGVDKEVVEQVKVSCAQHTINPFLVL